MKQFRETIFFVFLIIIILFLPFQSFLSEVLSFHTNLPEPAVFWILHWYEPVIVAGCVVWGVLSFFKSKDEHIEKSQIIAWLLVVFGALSIIFISSSVGRGLEGFRFTLFSLLFYLFVIGVDSKKIWADKIINLYFGIAFFIAVWAIFERVLPLQYWNNWGIIGPSAVFGYGWHIVAIKGAYQSASFLDGPNQLASYLLPAFFITFFKITNLKKYSSKLNIFLLLIFLSAIILSFSRSALVGLIVSLFIFAIFFVKQRGKLISLSGLSLSLFLVVWFLIYNPTFKNLLTHGGQVGHQISYQVTATEINNRFHNHLGKLIVGSGLGTAGPLAVKYGDGIISESWYFQLVLELGLIGLALWLCFIFFISNNLLAKKEYGLFLGLISVSVTAIFLHTFADNPALAYTLFILIALRLNSEQDYGKNSN